MDTITPLKNQLFDIIDIMYLDWMNSFISIESFADHYGLSKKQANIIINTGRKLNNLKFK